MSSQIEASLPSPFTIWTTDEPHMTRTSVVLDGAGMSWQSTVAAGRASAPWDLIGGLEHRAAFEQRPVTEILAIDGRVLGTIRGEFHLAGTRVSLPQLVTMFRPDLFVEVGGNLILGFGGCIRREVASVDS